MKRGTCEAQALRAVALVEGSFTIGAITIDRQSPSVVWVGTGENNAQRVVAYGDGVYKSIDGGKSWTNMGLKESEHIGRIVIDPRNSDVVYVAAQGPLWPRGVARIARRHDGDGRGVRAGNRSCRRKVMQACVTIGRRRHAGVKQEGLGRHWQFGSTS